MTEVLLAEIQVLKERIKELEEERRQIYKVLSDNFEPPCQLEFEGIADTADFIGASWCEQNCTNDGNGGTEICWKRLIQLIRECGKELNEYGKEQDERES